VSQPRLHDDQLPVTAELVRQLLAAQVPALADEPIRRIRSTGTVNALFRVGDGALARLPIMADWSDPDAEAATLARVVPHLSVRVPDVRHVGLPGAGYPQRWLLLEWIDGETVAPGTGGTELADDLAGFLRELWTVPTAGARAGYRVGLRRHDAAVRESLAAASDLVDVAALTRRWDSILETASWGRPPRWTHSDLLAGNVLLDGAGRLTAVLDWESAGVGDPACDLMAAWSMLDRAGRERMRQVLDLDDDTWTRGSGWALLQAAIALPYYRDTNPGLVAHSLHVLGELTREADAPG